MVATRLFEWQIFINDIHDINARQQIIDEGLWDASARHINYG